MQIEILSASLDDADAMRALINAIPNGDALLELLASRRPVSTRAYEEETETARYVESDGRIVICYSLSAITIDQAEMIEVGWEEKERRDEKSFRDVAQRVLGL